MTREGLIEVMARRMAEAERGPTSVYGYATAALAAIEAAGVRLVPVEATEEMVSAYYDEMPTPYHIDMRDTGEARQAIEHVLAASPYAPQKDESHE